MNKEILRQLIILSIEDAYKRGIRMNLNGFDMATHMFVAGMRLKSNIDKVV